MFKPSSAKDRINYGDVLMPPVGFHLEHAIGTTYSLDLETLAAVSISLGLIADTDSELMNNPISMLNAFQKVSDKIVVFCEAGQIHTPSKPNALCLMLEKMVVPVTIPYDRRINRFPSFHPKTWLIEYRNNNGEKKYRFIVMSRNMTFDHSWDVACALDGYQTDGEDVNVQPVIAFLDFLKSKLNKNLSNYDRQYNELNYFINTLSSIHFDVDERFSTCDILPLGIGAGSYNMLLDPLFTDNYNELVVVSPFLSGGIIIDWNNPRRKRVGPKHTLITRRSELSKLQGGKASNFDVYVMKDSIVDGESIESEGTEENSDAETRDQDIHAKIYIKRRNNDVDFYIGSMNASYAAVHSNVEMMLRLHTKKSIYDGEKFLNDIMGEDREGKKNPFERACLDNLNKEEASDRDDAEQMIKRVCRCKMSASVIAKEDGYDLHVLAEINNDINGVTIRPLRRNQVCDLLPEVCFYSLSVLELSEFYAVTATVKDCTLERIIMIPTSGIPEERDAAIIRSVIKDKKSFIQYVAFILGEDYVQSFLENKNAYGLNGEWGQNDAIPAVYEKMLKTSVSDPDRLKEIDYIIRAIDKDDIVPAEFREMYDVFCETLILK